MRILITGGFGFIGGRLGARLAQAGHHVVLGSRNSFSSPAAWCPNAEVARFYWNDDAALEQSCRGIDLVIHAMPEAIMTISHQFAS